MNPQIQIALAVISVITLIGVIASLLRSSKNYKGYEEHRAEFARILSWLRGEMFRDGDDLVITGNHQKRPVQVRFSISETTPGLNIRMQAPVSFTFSVVPKGATSTEGRVLIRTGDDMFDAKFATRTDHPTQAKMLVSSNIMRKQMEKLCCSSKTYLALTRGLIDVSELIIPSPYTARHVQDHVESMGILAKAVEDIPGAESVKIVPYQREKSTPVARLALAAGAVCTLIAVFVIKPSTGQADLSAFAEPTLAASGVAGSDLRSIPGLKGWRAAAADDFAGEIGGWLRGSGIDPQGRMPADLGGEGDVIYWLRNEKDASRNRLIFLRDRKAIYDSLYPNVVGAARVPQSSVENLEWKARPAAPPTTDAVLLLTRTAEGDVNPVIVYFSQERVISGVPAEYESISLQ